MEPTRVPRADGPERGVDGSRSKISLPEPAGRIPKPPGPARADGASCSDREGRLAPESNMI